MQARGMRWIAAIAACAVMLFLACRWTPPAGTIAGVAREMDTSRKPHAKIRREGLELHIELSNFPSYESTFQAPKVSINSKGKVVVSLSSYSAGPFHRKSEQLTDVSFTIPAGSAQRGSTIEFISGDYDQVVVSAEAP